MIKAWEEMNEKLEEQANILTMSVELVTILSKQATNIESIAVHGEDRARQEGKSTRQYQADVLKQQVKKAYKAFLAL